MTLESRIPLNLRPSEKSAPPDRPMTIVPHHESLAKTSLYHKTKRNNEPTKAMKGTRAILYHLSNIQEPASIRRIARDLDLDQHSASGYCRELQALNLLYAVRDIGINDYKPRYGISLLGKLAAVSTDSEEEYRHVNRNQLLTDLVSNIPYVQIEPFARFGQRLLSKFLQYNGYDMVLHWAKFASRFVVQNYIDEILATAWNTLPERLSYRQTAAFFIVFDHVMPQMQRDEFEPISNWLYRVSIFNRNYMDYMLREYGSDGMERIQKLLSMLKEWRAEDLDEANRNALLSSDAAAEVLSK